MIKNASIIIGLLLVAFMVLILCCAPDESASAYVIREGGKVYIVDQQGERWDVTQAESLGFDPGGFQYGMGRNFFTPLDDTFLSSETDNVYSDLRVLGVSDGKEARAYSVPRLSRHEIANSRIGNKPIAVGY